MKKWLSLVLILTMLVSFAACGASQPVAVTMAPTETAVSPAEAAMEDTARVLEKKFSSLQMGSIGGEWALIGLVRSGAEVPQSYLDDYYANLETYVQSCQGVLDTRKYTEYSRVILAVTAGEESC